MSSSSKSKQSSKPISTSPASALSPHSLIFNPKSQKVLIFHLSNTAKPALLLRFAPTERKKCRYTRDLHPHNQHALQWGWQAPIRSQVLTIYRPAISPNVGESNSTSAKPTPPLSSPAPSCPIMSRTSGPTVLQEGHHDAVQKVIRAVRFEAWRSVRVSKSAGERMLEGMVLVRYFGNM